MTHTGPEKQICAFCGSKDVTVDALAAWNAELQMWEIASLLQNGDCNACGNHQVVARPLYSEKAEG